MILDTCSDRKSSPPPARQKESLNEDNNSLCEEMDDASGRLSLEHFDFVEAVVGLEQTKPSRRRSLFDSAKGVADLQLDVEGTFGTDSGTDNDVAVKQQKQQSDVTSRNRKTEGQSSSSPPSFVTFTESSGTNSSDASTKNDEVKMRRTYLLRRLISAFTAAATFILANKCEIRTKAVKDPGFGLPAEADIYAAGRIKYFPDKLDTMNHWSPPEGIISDIINSEDTRRQGDSAAAFGAYSMVFTTKRRAYFTNISTW